VNLVCPFRALLGALALLLLASLHDSAAQQVTAQLQGHVTDDSGAIIPGCRVELRPGDPAGERTTSAATTDSSGSYRFPSVSPGSYELVVECRAFRSWRQNLTVAVGEALSVNARISAGTVKVVEVLGSGPATVSPTWNSWAEQSPFTPEQVLRTNTVYSLVLDLGACAYASSRGVYSKAASQQFKNWLSDTEEGVFKVLAIPDQSHIQLTSDSQRVQLMRVNTKRLKKQLGKKLVIKKDPFAELRKSNGSSLSFGRVAFSIRTTSAAGATHVFLSLWANDQPVDEIVVPLCVGSAAECDTNVHSTTLRGLDSLRIAAGKGQSELPDAALHFVSLDDNSVIGVFRCNSCRDWQKDEFHTWRLGRTADWLANYLMRTVLVDFENAASEDVFLRHGRELFSALFPPEDGGSPARSDDTFQKFLESRGPLRGNDKQTSIFVRGIFGNENELLLVPIGLAVAPADKQHLGLLYRIELPLPQQRYERTPACLSNWSLFVPKRNPNACDSSNLAACNEMQKLAFSFGDWADELSRWPSHTQSFYDTTTDIDKFSSWLNDFHALPQSSQVLFVMSHHDQDRLFFDPSGQDTIEATGVQRRFLAPTFVFLNACGTGKPGALEFVRRFNERGVNAVIATNTAVDAELAGLFAATLLSNLQQHSNDTGYTLGSAWFEAVQTTASITDRNGHKYGARALAYMLAGDAGINVCVPPKSH
jgi:hypothetical protein